VCPPDMNCFDSRELKWQRLKDLHPGSIQVNGRKNFAMALCDDQMFVSGGMDNGQNLLSEFFVNNLEDGIWQELHQKRHTGKDKSRQHLHAQTDQHEQREIKRRVSVQSFDSRDHLQPQGLSHTQPTKKLILRRSHHTMCTIKGRTEKLKGGYKVEYFTSYIFGGII